MSPELDLKRRSEVCCGIMILASAVLGLRGAVATEEAEADFSGSVLSVENTPSEQTKVDAGSNNNPRAFVTQRTFEGNRFWGDSDLRAQLAGPRSVWRLLFDAYDPHDPVTIQSDAKTVTEKYQSAGFFDAQVTGKLRYSKDRSAVHLHFTVVEGDRYRIREVRYQGNNRINSVDLRRVSRLQQGDLYNSEAVSRDRQRILELYGTLGLKPSIDIVPHFTEEHGILDLVFEINEDSPAGP